MDTPPDPDESAPSEIGEVAVPSFEGIFPETEVASAPARCGATPYAWLDTLELGGPVEGRRTQGEPAVRRNMAVCAPTHAIR